MQLSVLGLGGGPFGNLYGSADEDECIELVRYMIRQVRVIWCLSLSFGF